MSLLAGLCLAVWLTLLFARGGFWRVGADLLPDEAAAGARLPSVLAIVPARNEADILGETLPTLLRQTYRGPFHILLVDDSSEDGTGARARRLADENGFAARLTVLCAKPVPAGWTGKLWAMQAGLDWTASRPDPPDLVLFTDADIAYAPDLLARLVALAERRNTVLTSLMVQLRAASPAERLLVPAFVFFFKMLYPFAWVRDPRRRTAAAAGGSMLVRRSALVEAGGLREIRGALIDDCALGRLMKRRGPVWLGLTHDARSVRPYPRVADIRRMVVRSAYAELRYSPWRLVLALAGLTLVFFVPPLSVLLGHGAAPLAGLAAWAAMAVAFAPMLRFYRVNRGLSVILPGIAAFYAWFTLDSAVQHWRGRGGAWKGRLQAQAGRPAGT